MAASIRWCEIWVRTRLWIRNGIFMVEFIEETYSIRSNSQCRVDREFIFENSRCLCVILTNYLHIRNATIEIVHRLRKMQSIDVRRSASVYCWANSQQPAYYWNISRLTRAINGETWQRNLISSNIIDHWPCHFSWFDICLRCPSGDFCRFCYTRRV